MLPVNLDIQDAWSRFKSYQDEQAREVVVLRYAYLVNITAGRLVSNLPPNLDREDLVSAGIVGLIKAVDQFDPEQGVKFETYAIALIRGAIQEMLREEDWVPRSIRDRAKMLERAYLKLETDFGRPATEQEVAKSLNIELDQLYAMLSETARTSVMSLDELLLGGEGSETGVKVSETIAKGVDTISKVERGERIRLLAEAVSRLPLREKMVIELYYIEGMTFREIGRVMEISESRAYQLHTQAVIRMSGYLSKNSKYFKPEVIHSLTSRQNKSITISTQSKSAEEFIKELTEDIHYNENMARRLKNDSNKRESRRRQELMKGSISMEEVANLLGISSQDICERTEKGLLLAIPDNGQLRYPAWQFDSENPDGVVNGLTEILHALLAPPLTKMYWLKRPSPILENRTPLQALHSGEVERVIALARGVNVI